MKQYKIDIEITDYGGVCYAETLEEAKSIAEEICNDIYKRLSGDAGVYVKNVEELKCD